MADPQDSAPKPGIWRILKFILPVLFLLIGFFGVQIWMVWDEKDAVKTETPVSAEASVRSAKAELAKLSGDVKAETPVAPMKGGAAVPGAEQAITAEIPDIEYYRIQVGSFENPQGAEKLKQKLSEMGYGSVMVKSDNQTKVIAMAFFSREQADALKTSMDSKGVSGYPEKVVVPAEMALLQSDSGRLQGFMDGTLVEVPEMLRELCDFYYLYENQPLNTKEHEALTLKQITRLSDMRSQVENMQVAEVDQGLQKQLRAYLDGYVQYLEKARKVGKYDRRSLWPGLLERLEAYGQLTTKNEN